MKKLFTLLSITLVMNFATAQTITYSESFTNGNIYSSGDPQYDNWITFRSQLDTGEFNFTSVTIKGDFDLIGISCTDITIVNQIATAIKNGNPGISFAACDGIIWRVGDCAGGTELNANNLGTDCACTNPGYTLRPGIGNTNWGGVNTITCNAPSQTMTVEFEYLLPMLTGQKAFGGAEPDDAESIQQTNDGGYIIVGKTGFGAGSWDIYLNKIDVEGNIQWSKTYGGTGIEYGYSVQQTTDGGYIIAGSTKSFGAGSDDVYLIRTDAVGDTLWTKTYGGTQSDAGYSVRQTAGGGFIIAGHTRSFGDGDDVYLIKTDASGNTLWTKTFARLYTYGYSVQETADSGYIVGGYDYLKCYLLRTDVDGNMLWSKTYGGDNYDFGNSVQQTSDGGFIFLGETKSFGAGVYDVYLIKTDSNGDTLWVRTYGGTNNDYGKSVKQTPDGGYIIAGYTESFGAGSNDVYLIKTSANGVVIWSKTYGGTGDDFGNSVQLTNDGGYIIAGKSDGFGAGDDDIYLIKTDAFGNSCNANTPATITSFTSTTVPIPAINISSGATVGSTSTLISNPSTVNTSLCDFETPPEQTFQKVYHGTYDDYAYSIQQTSDGGYIVAGNTASFGSGSQDVYLIKLNDIGDTMWTKVYGGSADDWGTSVQQTSDAGYLVTGYTESFGAGGKDIYMIRTNNLGDTIWTKTYGSAGWDMAYSAIETNDNGYIITGMIGFVACLIKTDSDGDTLWTRKFGGGDYGRSVLQTSDGGYVMAGYTDNFGAGSNDVLLVRTDGNGDMLWTKVFGGAGLDNGYSVKQTADGGFAVMAITYSFGAGNSDFYLIRTDASGNLLWSKIYGSTSNDEGIDFDQTPDGGFVMTGHVNIFGPSHYLIRVDLNGNLAWTKKFGGDGSETAQSVISTADRGYILTGYSTSFTNGSKDFYVVKTDADGNSFGCHQVSVGLTVGTPATIENSTGITVSAGLTIGTTATVVNSAATQVTDLAISTTFTNSDVSCKGGSDGAADLSPSGGIPTYTYLWNDPGSSTTEDISSIPAGTYTVTVTDDKSCTAIDTVVINEPTLLTTIISSTDVTCNGGNDGTATIAPLGGTPPYNYFWSMGQITPTAIGLYPATYTVNVVDNQGCPATNIIIITEPNALAASITGTDATCYGGSNGSADLTVIGGTLPYTFLWDDPGTSTTADLSGLTAGTYEVDITDNCTASITDTVVIDQPTALISSIAVTGISCNGIIDGTVDLSVSGGTPPYNYLWDDPGTSTTQDISGLPPGTYTVDITDACAIAIPDTAVIYEPAVLTTIISKTDVSCYGGGDGTATVTPSGGTPPYNYLWNIGQTDSVAVALFPGNYGVNVFDANGCLASNSITVTQPAVLAISITGTDASCYGGSDGTADLSVSGGTTPYTFIWNDPGSSTTEDISGLAAGTYSVTVIDSCGANIPDSVIIAEPPALASSITKTDISCNGNSDGLIDLTVSGGTLPYTYQWDDPGTSITQDISGLSPGIYTVDITDACAIAISDSAIINEPAVLTTTMSKTDVSCNGGGDGSATLYASGGTPPYNYLWNNGQTTSTAMGFFPGNYTVNVTDINGCLASDIVTITQPPALVISVTGTDASCYGGNDGTADLSVSGGTTPYTFIWNDPGSGTTEDISGLAAGTYSVTVVDSCGANTSNSVIIAEPPALASSTTKTDISCNGNSDGSIDLTVSGGTLPYIYQWNDPGTNITQDISGLQPGTYTVDITDACAIVVSDSAVINEPAVLTTTMSKTDVSCNGGGDGSATLTASGGTPPYNYSWNNGQTTSTAVGLFPGNYTVNVTDANGCLATDIITIAQPGALAASITGTTDVSCNSDSTGSAIVTPSGGTSPYTYLWDDPGLQTGTTATGLPAGIYTVIITDSCGNPVSEAVIIDEPLSLASSVTQTDVSCNGYADGTASVTVSNGTVPYTYSWSPGGETANSLSGLDTGTYVLTTTDLCSDIIYDTVIISQPLTLITTMTKSDVSCYGGGDGSATLTASGGTPPYNYLWNNGQVNSLAIGLFPGNYTVNVTDFNNCLSSDIITITQPSPLSASVTSTDVNCMVGGDGSATVTTSGGTPPYYYLWSPSGDTTAFATGLDEGTYIIMVTDSCGASVSGSVVVNGPGTMNAVITWTDVSCNGFSDGTINLTVSSATPPLTYMWSTGDTIEDLSGLSIGTYTFTVTDSCGTTVTDSVVINEPALLTTSILGTDVKCNGAGDGTATVTPSGGTSPYYYLWNNNQTNSTIIGLFPSNYTVNVTDFNNCLSSNIITINEPPALILSMLKTDATCGNADGYTTVSASGGTAPYAYLWSNGGTGTTITGLADGVYSVTVT
ncbi:MAG: SprB repeat-containing protein, partial [Bacteroidota bacterium]